MNTTIDAAQSTGDWPFWSIWGLAFLAFPLGGLAGQAVAGPVDTPGAGFLAGAATGAVIGAIQWFVLRRRAPLSVWWIAATAAGMALGLAVSTQVLGVATVQPELALRGLITGSAIGLAQWPLVRSWGPRSAIWMPVVALGWALGWTITQAAGVDLTPQWSVFGSTGAWAFQGLTGVALAWMLRHAPQ